MACNCMQNAVAFPRSCLIRACASLRAHGTAGVFKRSYLRSWKLPFLSTWLTDWRADYVCVWYAWWLIETAVVGSVALRSRLTFFLTPPSSWKNNSGSCAVLLDMANGTGYWRGREQVWAGPSPIIIMLRRSATFVAWNHIIFDNNLRIQNYFKIYLNESCR